MPFLFGREDFIQAVGVDSEGNLFPMSGLRENSPAEQGESGSEKDGEAGEKNWNVSHPFTRFIFFLQIYCFSSLTLFDKQSAVVVAQPAVLKTNFFKNGF